MAKLGEITSKTEFSIQNWGKLQIKLEFCYVGGSIVVLLEENYTTLGLNLDFIGFNWVYAELQLSSNLA